MYALIKNDLVVGRTTEVQMHGITLETTQFSTLRFNGSELIDISSLGPTTFYIDAVGVKHIVAAADRQALLCKFTDTLSQVDGRWVVLVDSTVEANQLESNIQATCDELLDRVAREIDRRIEDAAEWCSYRQFLQRLPEQEGYPDNIDWGSQPAEFTGE